MSALLLANDIIPIPAGLTGSTAVLLSWMVALLAAIKFFTVDLIGQWRQTSREKHTAELDKLRLERIKLWLEIQELKQETGNTDDIAPPLLALPTAVRETTGQPPETAARGPERDVQRQELPAITYVVSLAYERLPSLGIGIAVLLCPVFLIAGTVLVVYGGFSFYGMYRTSANASVWMLVPVVLVFFLLPTVFMFREAFALAGLLRRWWRASTS